MDGKTDQAIEDVRKAIESRRPDLYMAHDETLRPSPVISSPQVEETLHNYGLENRFTVYHIFLPLH
jgi:hypothetical protein